MVLTSDSDDDFVSNSKDFWLFKNKASSSKRKKKEPVRKSLPKSSAPKKKKLKLIMDDGDHQNKKISNEVEPKTNMEKSEPEFCSLCQMPFSLLHRRESTAVHINSCMGVG